MQFNLSQSIEILERTPAVVEMMLEGLSGEWINADEGHDTWSPFDIVGHYIQGEKEDWIARMNIILSGSENRQFTPFDRFAQLEASKGRTLKELLDEFKFLRALNIQILKSKNLNEEDLAKKGIHPVFGEVSLAQLLSTWVVHDLNHIGQISRVMAKRYKHDVGPWIEYLKILKI